MKIRQLPSMNAKLKLSKLKCQQPKFGLQLAGSNGARTESGNGGGFKAWRLADIVPSSNESIDRVTILTELASIGVNFQWLLCLVAVWLSFV